MASNSGTVVLARELFYEGNCVALGHGQHFFPIYMHLSKIQVRQGQKVQKRGGSGIKWRYGTRDRTASSYGRPLGGYVDPTKLFALTLPETNKVIRSAGTQSVRRRR